MPKIEVGVSKDMGTQLLEDDVLSPESLTFMNFTNLTEDKLTNDYSSLPCRVDSFQSHNLDFNHFNPKYYPLTPKIQHLKVQLKHKL